MGLHQRLFGSSLLTTYRYNISINLSKQTLRFHHDNTTTKKPTKFLLQRCLGNENDYDKKKENYLSVLSTDSERMSPEKNFYFRSPSGAQPPYPFAIIGENNNNNNNNNIFSDHEIFKPPYSTRIIGSCDGLICLENDKDKDDLHNVILWNPLINEFKVINYSSIKRQPRSAPSSIFTCAGFGFDLDSKEYKLLMQVENIFADKNDKYQGSECKYEVCSLKPGTWSPVRTPKVVPRLYPSSSVYIDGFCYRGAYNADGGGSYILSFNFADEKFSYFPVPKTREEFELVEYEGLLGIVLYGMTGSSTDKDFELWVREKDESWRKVASMCVPNVGKPLAYLEREKLFFVREGRVLLLDLTTKQVERLGIYDYFWSTMNMIPFVESTISPSGAVK